MTNKQIHILVVDDELDMLWSLQKMLSYDNYTVTTALSAREALQAVQCQAFALAIIDAKLPDMDGLQVANQLKRITPTMPIILISGYYYGEDPEIEREVQQKVAANFISKPFSLREIRSTIQEVLVS